MTITITVHDVGRSYRTSRERFMNMEQALDIHDPFAGYPFSELNLSAPHPCWTFPAKNRIRFI